MKSIYLAGPWFTPNQLELLERIKAILDKHNLKYYSPKDECLFTNIVEMNPFDVLNSNCNAILDSQFIIAITDDKDVGTMWECGYAYANKIPILYIWWNRKEGQKFNLMLAASGAIAYNEEQIINNINYFIRYGKFNINVDMDVE